MNPYYYNKFYGNKQERFVPFVAPFLLGAVVGGGAVAVTNPYRPRPYYPANQPYPPRPPYQPYPYFY